MYIVFHNSIYAFLRGLSDLQIDAGRVHAAAAADGLEALGQVVIQELID